MGDFVMRPEDEMTHKPDASVNFNESVYTNGFDTASPVGGWMRLGNRVNEGYAELSVCLYLPDGRIACQFQRPSIASNARFDAGGLSYAALDPLKKVSMTFDGELLIVPEWGRLRLACELGVLGVAPGVLGVRQRKLGLRLSLFRVVPGE